MNDIDAIIWSRDIILMRNDVDADVVYNAAKLAEEDGKMYDLFVDYALYEGSRNKQTEIYNDVVDYMEELNLC